MSGVKCQKTKVRRQNFFKICYQLSVISYLLLTACAAPTYKRAPLVYVPSDYIKLDEFCGKYNFQYDFDTIDDLIELSSLNQEIRLLLNCSVGYFNGKISYFKRPILYRQGKILVPKELDKIISSKAIVSFRPALSIKTIVIDPGHGGGDPGAISSNGIKEKNLNLKVAKYLKGELQKRGLKVILTRERDAYLTLGERTRVAKKYNADLFVSIHANSNRARYLKGVEIYYLSAWRFDPEERAVRLAKGGDFGELPDDVKAILWSLTLSRNYAASVEFSHTLYFVFKNLGFKTAPPKQANFYILHYAYVPAVLVEMGYISNRYEEKILRKSYYQKQIAEAIALGVVSLNKRYQNLAGK